MPASTKRPYNRVFDDSTGKKKRCPHCGIIKSLSDFYRSSHSATGHKSHCKSCQALSASAKASPSAVRRRKLMLKYGIRVQDYDGMYLVQKGRCAICGQAGRRYADLAVDHDHASGRVRGLLCRFCNLGLAHFRDNAALLSTASTYLLKASQSNLAG